MDAWETAAWKAAVRAKMECEDMAWRLMRLHGDLTRLLDRDLPINREAVWRSGEECIRKSARLSEHLNTLKKPSSYSELATTARPEKAPF